MMTRSTFRNLWILVIAVLVSTSFYIYKKADIYQAKISRANSQLERLQRDLRAGNQLSAALAELDKVTINENVATHLDILRHLGLEKTELDFRTLAKTERKIGSTSLFVRTFSLQGNLPYMQALQQLDWLHNTKKVVLRNITLTPGSGYGDSVKLSVEGRLYGIDKKRK